jgi:hypothetical protein
MLGTPKTYFAGDCFEFFEIAPSRVTLPADRFKAWRPQGNDNSNRRPPGRFLGRVAPKSLREWEAAWIALRLCQRTRNRNGRLDAVSYLCGLQSCLWRQPTDQAKTSSKPVSADPRTRIDQSPRSRLKSLATATLRNSMSWSRFASKKIRPFFKACHFAISAGFVFVETLGRAKLLERESAAN